MRLLSRRKTAPVATELPIAHADARHARLVDDAGRSVWPVTGTDDHNALRAVAATFGSQLAETPARPGDAAHQDGLVYGIEGTEDAAGLYAHLTGRRLEMGTIVELTARTDDLPDVVIFCAPALDRSLLSWLTLMPNGVRLPGLVWGRSPAELDKIVLVCSAAARLHGPTPPVARVDVVPLSHTGLVEAKRKVLLGGATREEDMRAWLGRTTGLLSFYSHGNTTSIYIAPRLALCMVHGIPANADRGHAPYCIEEGYCTTLRAPLRDLRRTALLDPDTLAARIIVISSCLAVPLGNVATSPEWSFFPQLLANPSVGAVVGSIELNTVSYFRLAQDLLKPLEHGAAIGDALQHFERSPDTARLRQRYLLFGDPRTRATASAGALAEDDWSMPEGAPYDEEYDMDVNVMRALSEQTREDHAASVNTAVALGEALDVVARVRQRADGAVLRRAEHLARLATLDHVRTLKGRTFLDGRLGWDTCTRDVDARPCPGCGWPVRPYVWAANGDRRLSISCASCRDIMDMPDGADVDLELDLPTVNIHGTLPDDDWDAALFVASDRPTEIVMHRWPAEPDGSPARSLAVKPSAWPSGQLDVRFVLFHRLTMYSVLRLSRRPAGVGRPAGGRRAKSGGRGKRARR